jgi:hypothetical protein
MEESSSRNIGGRVVNLISRRDLMRNKRASGRPQDLLDLEWLRAAGEESE